MMQLPLSGRVSCQKRDVSNGSCNYCPAVGDHLQQNSCCVRTCFSLRRMQVDCKGPLVVYSAYSPSVYSIAFRTAVHRWAQTTHNSKTRTVFFLLLCTDFPTVQSHRGTLLIIWWLDPGLFFKTTNSSPRPLPPSTLLFRPLPRCR
jgi:hypothetical protein